MQISAIFFSFVGAFLVIRLFFLPLVQKTTPVDLSRRPRRVALIAAVNTISNMLFWLSISTGLTWAVIWYLQEFQPVDLGEAENMLKNVRSWIGLLRDLTNGTGIFAAAAAAVGLLWWSYRRTLNKKTASIEAKITEEMEKVRNAAIADDLPEMEPTEAMEQVAGEILHLRGRIADIQGDEEAQTVQELREQEKALLQIYHLIDFRRRAELNLHDEFEKEDASLAKVPAWKMFFVSKGFHDTLGGFGKVLAVLGLLAVIPASLVATGPLAIDALDTKKIALEDDTRRFEFRVASGGVNQAWESAVENGADAELSEEDIEAAEQLGALAEANVSVVDISAISPSRAHLNLRRETARRAILGRATARATGLSLASAPRSSVSTAMQHSSDIVSTLDLNKPNSQLGKTVSKDAKSLAKRNPALWKRTKNSLKAYRASFGVAAPPHRLQAIIVNQAIGDLAGNLGAPSSFWGQQAQRFGANVSSNASEAYSKAAARSFLLDFAKTGDIKKAAQTSGQLAAKSLPRSQVRALQKTAELVPRDLNVQRAVGGQRVYLQSNTLTLPDAQAQRAVSRASSYTGGNARAANVTVEFADFFPGYAGQDFDTPSAKAARNLSLKGAKPTLSAALSSDLKASRAAAARSGSYGRLRGFSRIGGVLIGRPAENEAMFTTSHFDWSVSTNGFTFEIQLSGGEKKRFGPYSPAIANLALLYAADGRPTTVTMVTADPVPDLRILLHPALVDTGLGCRARRLDQFVDEVNDLSSELSQARNFELGIAQGEVELYNLARHVNFLTLAKTPTGQAFLQNNDLQNWVSQTEQRAASEQLRSKAAYRLSVPGVPLTLKDKPAYFWPSLVELVSYCSTSENLPAFELCVAKEANSRSTFGNRDQWIAPTVEYQSWSGVREKAYRFDENFSFLQANQSDGLGPLRFMVQLAISSPAFFADPNAYWHDSKNTAPDDFSDPKPWEFMQTNRELAKVLPDVIISNSERKEIFRDMSEFTLLQRFFRAAIDGNLSDSFPFEELPKIVEATSHFVTPEIKTLRWNAQQGSIERGILNILRNHTRKSDAVDACILSLEDPESPYLPTELWQKTCAIDEIEQSVFEDQRNNLRYYFDIQSIRMDLGIPKEALLASQLYTDGCARP